MKIFDFTQMRKGKQVANINRCNSEGNSFIPGTQQKWVVSGKFFANTATTPVFDDDNQFVEESEITVEDFGVEAIAFCTGKFNGEWMWRFMGTEAWVAENHPPIIPNGSNAGIQSAIDSLTAALGSNALTHPDAAIIRGMIDRLST